MTEYQAMGSQLELDGIITSAEYIKMRYTRSSAGTGAVFTDETQVAGTNPTIIFKG
jgi:hypothetical protein